MQYQRDLDRLRPEELDEWFPEGPAPGRVSRSQWLPPAPAAPVASGLVMRKARDANGVAADADEAVAAAARGGGAALPNAVQRTFEQSLGVDLAGVRVHTGAASAHAARAVAARAYTVGQDIHFAAGQYDPHGESGRHLLAHEVAHTVQQRGAPATLSRVYSADDWNKDQDYSDAETKAPGADGWDPRFGNSRKDNIGQPTSFVKDHPNDPAYAPMKPASEQGGVAKKSITVTGADIDAIYAEAAKAAGTTADEITRMSSAAKAHLAQMNAAFEAMGIDTVQAQALFLAHSAGEAEGGDAQVENGAKGRKYAPFQGRGPLQVTNKGAYIRTFSYLEARSAQLDKSIKEKQAMKDELEKLAQRTDEQETTLKGIPDEIAKLQKQKADVDECYKAVKADVRQAANPKYSYLFSAAYMHASKGVEKSGKVGETTTFDGVGPDEDWESGGNNQVNLDDPKKADGSPNMKSYTFEQYKALQQKHGQTTGDMDSAISRGKIKQAVYNAAYARFVGKLKDAPAKAP